MVPCMRLLDGQCKRHLLMKKFRVFTPNQAVCCGIEARHNFYPHLLNHGRRQLHSPYTDTKNFVFLSELGSAAIMGYERIQTPYSECLSGCYGGHSEQNGLSAQGVNPLGVNSLTRTRGGLLGENRKRLLRSNSCVSKALVTA